jgi:hypothetical protein
MPRFLFSTFAAPPLNSAASLVDVDLRGLLASVRPKLEQEPSACCASVRLRLRLEKVNVYRIGRGCRKKWHHRCERERNNSSPGL